MKPHLSPRLYVEADLRSGLAVTAGPEQAHYLRHVMRLKEGDAVRLFNGRDGEWLGEITAEATKKPSKHAGGARIVLLKPLRVQGAPSDLWLCAAPIKKAHFDYMVEKATELGVGAIRPILTARTQVRDANIERLRAIAVEAAEQSERLDVPAIHEPAKLENLLVQWPADQRLIVCAEWGEAMPAYEAFARLDGAPGEKAAILVGPEGGLAAEELDLLRQVPQGLFIRLGPRILRADTAAIAALSVWQAVKGDWSC
ncbi:MAG TPA: 16S rRNA (uracil(1498)-N(3))-methyltransferase [Alphaproteobacteria bacterium]|nr:16S rRNA (uracil(1498)-N(3))-methyltransferase [Alphaproteobacteria bacterium]